MIGDNLMHLSDMILGIALIIAIIIGAKKGFIRFLSGWPVFIFTALLTGRIAPYIKGIFRFFTYDGTSGYQSITGANPDVQNMAGSMAGKTFLANLVIYIIVFIFLFIIIRKLFKALHNRLQGGFSGWLNGLCGGALGMLFTMILISLITWWVIPALQFLVPDKDLGFFEDVFIESEVIRPASDTVAGFIFSSIKDASTNEKNSNTRDNIDQKLDDSKTKGANWWDKIKNRTDDERSDATDNYDQQNEPEAYDPNEYNQNNAVEEESQNTGWLDGSDGGVQDNSWLGKTTNFIDRSIEKGSNLWQKVRQ